MGTKYPANTISGYNASPPSDDGSVTASNRVDWNRAVKVKIGDPLKVFTEDMQSDLEEAFDYGATLIDTSTTIDEGHNAQFCEISTACTVTLSDAAQLGASWHVFLKNTSAGTVVINRASPGDTIDGTATDASLGSMDCMIVAVNAGLDGFIKLADSAGMGTGSGGGAGGQTESFIVPISDETTELTTGTAKVTFRFPYAFTLTAVRASLSTASSSGTPTFDINESGSTILSTKITIDENEKTSTTAATPPVMSDTSIADDAEITIDIDVAGTGATGAKITFIGNQT